MAPNLVQGQGPQPSKYCLILDSPNQEDANKRRPLSGRAGKELDRFFDDFHIPSRSKWFITFSYKLLWDDKKPPSAEDVAQHREWLMSEIAEVHPRVVVIMGKRTLSAFLGDAHQIDDWHGIATTSPLVPKAAVMPCVSPGHAFVNAEFYRKFVIDMQRLELLLKGKLPPQPVDDGVGDYRLLTRNEVYDALLCYPGEPPPCDCMDCSIAGEPTH